MRMTIGGYIFDSKKDAQDTIRQILHSYPNNTILAGGDAALITALVGLHPHADEKIGPGIHHISVRIIEHGAPGFVITRLDGTIDDFSYKRALEGKELDHRQQVIRAMRRAIADQIEDFRRNEFTQRTQQYEAWDRFTDKHPNPNSINQLWNAYEELNPICPVTGIRLTNDPTTHVDHYEPRFVELAEKYAQDNGGFDNIPVISDSIRPGPRLTAPHQEQFRQFHKVNAQLRLIHRSANLMREKRTPTTE